MKARVLQAHLLDNQHYIADAVSKGDVVRFITRTESPSLPTDLLPKGVVAEQRPAELEDAFMLLLHEAKHTQKTVLAQENSALDPSRSLIENSDPPQVKTKQDVKQQLEKPVIVVKDLVRTFGDFTAVASTSFDVSRGEIFGLLGPNGAGKTTTFRMLCGFAARQQWCVGSGRHEFAHSSCTGKGKNWLCIAEVCPYGNFSVLDNLKFFGGAYGLSGKQLKQQIDKALLQFELKPHAKSGDLPNGFKTTFVDGSSTVTSA